MKGAFVSRGKAPFFICTVISAIMKVLIM